MKGDSLATDPEKLATMRNWTTPCNVREIRYSWAWLNTTTILSPWQDFANVAQPLTRLISKSVPWKWDAGTHQAFDRFKDNLTRALVLGYPDPKQPYWTPTLARKQLARGDHVTGAGQAREGDRILWQEAVRPRK